MSTPTPLPPLPPPSGGGIDLNPTLADLLRLHVDLVFLLPMLLAAGLYAWRCAQARRTPDGRARWPLWRVLSFAAWSCCSSPRRAWPAP